MEYKCKFYFLLFLIKSLFIISITVSGQTQYAQKLLSFEDGLHQKAINSIAFNKQGFAFIGTNIGFSVFNGSTFFNYYESDEFKGRMIEQILPMDSGTALLAEGEGLYLFKENKIKRLKLPNGNEILNMPTLFQTESNQYLVTVHGKVYKFTNGLLKDYLPKHKIYDLLQNDSLKAYYKLGKLEYFQSKLSFYVFDGKELTLLPNDFQARSISKIGNQLYVSSFFNKSYKITGTTVEELSFLDGIKVNSFVEIGNGEILALGESLFIFDSKKIKEEIIVPQSVGVKLNNAAVDLENNIWVATYEGLLKIYKTDFFKFNTSPQEKKYANSFHYYNDFEHPNWVFRITDSAVIGTSFNFPDSVFKSKAYLTKLLDLEFIYSFEQLDTNKFLVYSANGLWQISPTDFFEIKSPSGKRLIGYSVFKKFENNEVYLNNRIEGVLKIKDAKTYPINNPNFNALSFGLTLNGTKIYGGDKIGLFQIKNGIKVPILPDILPKSWVIDITIMKDSTIWAYYYWEGFAVLKESGGEFQLIKTYFNQFEELGKNLIYFEDLGSQFMAYFTEKGLSVLNKEGVQNNFPAAFFDYNPIQPNLVSALTMPSGNLCVALENQLTIIPKDVLENPWLESKPILAYISKISTLDTVYFEAAMATSFAEKYYFPTNTTLLKVQLSALYFSSPEIITYRYRFENIKNWNIIGKKGEILFSNLPFGTYKLIFQASMDGKNWGEAQYLAFEILTPWYRQNWFYFLIGFIIVLIAGLLMSARFKTIKRIYNIQVEKAELQTAKTKSELMALQTQMNPHLLLNTLTSIQSKILEEDNLAAAERISNLGALLTKTLQNSFEEFISLKEELLFLNNYINLYDHFVNEKWIYKVDLDESLNPEKTAIPVMMIQPLIENAIKHGLMNSSNEQNYLMLTIKLFSSELLQVEVLDSGPGPNGLHKKNHQNRPSIGNQNIKRRLEIYLNKHKVEASINFEQVYIEHLNLTFSKFSFLIPMEKLN